MRADRIRWNARYRAESELSFEPHPLALAVLGEPGHDAPAEPVRPSPIVPPGPVLELACGASGSALLAAAVGRRVTAVDVSDVALSLLAAEAEHRGLRTLINIVDADLDTWRPGPGRYALVLCTGFWSRDVFAGAVRALIAGGVISWEAFTTEARRTRPALSRDWCLAPGEPASLLPRAFTVIAQRDIASGQKRQLIAVNGNAAR